MGFVLRYNDSIQTIKGIGAVKAKYFKALGINNIEDILTDYPKRYEDLNGNKTN